MFEEETRVQLCNYLDVYRNERITDTLTFSKGSATSAEIDRFSLLPGDVLITKDSEIPSDIAAAALVGETAKGVVCGYHLAILRPKPELVLGEFLFWSVRSRSVLSQFSVRAQGVTRFGLTTGAIGEILLAVPPVRLQSIISAFLWRETAKIDVLVAEQERLIGLLNEKRQAFIFHTVTKGLSPGSPTKDSGVGWLGQIPAHWKMKRLKYVSPRVMVGIVVNPTEYVSDEGLPFLYGADIGEGQVKFQQASG